MHCYKLNNEAVCFMVSEDFLKSYSPLYITVSLWKGMVGMIYVGDHQTLIYSKYISCGPHCYRIEVFKSYSHYKSMRALDPHVHDKFASKGLDWQDLCRPPLDIAIYILNI